MAPIDADALAKLVDEKVARNNVMVFSKSYCPFGAKVEAYFKKLDVRYDLMYLDQMDTGAAIQDILLEKTGQKTVPNVFVAGSHLGGCDDTLGAAKKDPDFVETCRNGPKVEIPADDLSSTEAKKAKNGEEINYDYDLIVVGGGSGGLAASKEAAKLGLKTAVFDYVKPTPVGTTWGLGGTCVNVGCIPKKLMHQAALLGESMNDAKSYGWEVKSEGGQSGDCKPGHNWEKMVENIQVHIKGLNWGYKTALRSAQVKYFNELVEFTGPNTINATNKKGTTRELTAANFILAVGGRPRYPDIPGAKELGITSDDIFSLPYNPGKTLMVGASYISLETGGFLHGIGQEVTVMVRSVLLRGFDRQMADQIGDYMESHGINFVRPCVPTSLERVEEGQPGKIKVKGRYDDGTEYEDVFNTVIFAIGRDADTDSLALNTAGVKVNPKNKKVVVNDSERTSAANVYAIGDMIDGGLELTPVAIQAGKLLARRMAKTSEVKMDYKKVATTVFTPIEYGCVGLSEEEALAMYGEDKVEVFHTNFWPLEWTLPKRPENASYGKLICDKSDNDRVLGFHYLGPNAGEVTQGYAGMVKLGATKTDFDDLVGIHPTTAEIFTTLEVTKSSGTDPSASGC